MPTRTYGCRRVVGGVAEGPALVADTRISFWGGFDPVTGCIVEVGNPLEGESVAGKVVVFRSTKGSSGTSRMLRMAKIAGKSPVAFINTELDELSALSCTAQRLPLVTDLECDPFEATRTGDVIRVDADKGIVQVTFPDDRAVAPKVDTRVRPAVQMDLTREQQEMLDGADGPIRAEHLRLLVQWGEALGAERLVRAENVMPSGLCAPNHTLGDAPFEHIESCIDYARSCVAEEVAEGITATCHASCMDLMRPEQFGADLRQVAAQREILDLARKSGVSLTWTCTPYLVGNVPVKGQICAWTESHGVVYINSFLGARTTRNGNESAAAAMTTGWVPEFGVLRTANRRARFLVKVTADLKNDTDWGCLGFYVGKAAGLRIPALAGLRPPRLEAARQLCAALATSGGPPMLHVVGVTPEAPTLDAAFQGQEPEETVTFGTEELTSVYETLRTHTGPEIDFVYFGCPHASLQEVVEIARALRGKKVQEDVTLLITMPYAIEMQGRRLGFVQEIEEAGGTIMADSCPTNIFWHYPKRMATPAIKTAFYAQNLLGCEVVLASPEECIRTAETGRWHGRH